MAPLVELDHVSKAYEQKVAVRDLNLRIEPGTMFGLLGPNGAGKTSSIRMMVGITVPDSGTVSLFGRPIYAREPKESWVPSGRARALPKDEGDGPAHLHGPAPWADRGARREARASMV